jgi:ABC-type nickel/cobalt efflux system permease component RcnA/Tol biopolymer transport system component
MIRTRLSLLILLLLLILFGRVPHASAHPADVYNQSISVTLTKDRILIKWEIIPGPVLVSYIWYTADANKDNQISAEEAQAWADNYIALFTATLDHVPLKLQMESIQFPTDLDAFQSGAETITMQLSGALPENISGAPQLVIYDGVEEQKSINWYFVTAQDGVEFQSPQQDKNILTVKFYPPFAQTTLMTRWDSSVPSLPSQTVGLQAPSSQTDNSTSPGLLNFIPNGRNTPQEILLNLVRTKQFSVPFYIFALAVALALGALHALTPGHGKTVVAAYLVGSRGTMRHAVALGTVVTLTHTGSVFLLGIVTLVASRYFLPTNIIPLLEIISGLMILGLGGYLFRQRFQQWRAAQIKKSSRTYSLQPISSTPSVRSTKFKAASISPAHDHLHEHSHVHHHGDGRLHSHEVPEAITWRSLIALGVSGGLVPCPDAIAILLVAIAINRIALGLTLIVSFSLGLAVVLIVIGFLMVGGRRWFDRIGVLERFAPVLPMVSALVVLGLGAALTAGSFIQLKPGLSSTGMGTGPAQEAVLYLASGQNQSRRLFIADVNGNNPTLLSNAEDDVTEYSLSPDKTKVVYIVQSGNLENNIWLASLADRSRKILWNCENALCSRPVWSPNGERIIYEYTNITANNLTGSSTLWWINMHTGEAKPVFQEAQLPGANPRWSPDGKWLSYATPSQIKLYNFDTGENITLDSTLAPAVEWSPDGTKVLYRDMVSQNRQFVANLFVYDLLSKTSANISLDQGFENLSAAWSPDGKWIAEVRRSLSVERGDQIWLAYSDGTQPHALTDQPGELHENLLWSRDGKYLLYDMSPIDSTESDPDLQIIEVATGKITDTHIQGYNPEWLP